VEGAEEFVRVRVRFVEFGRDAQLAAPDGFACYSGGGEEAGAAEEEDGELAKRALGGYWCALISRLWRLRSRWISCWWCRIARCVGGWGHCA